MAALAVIPRRYRSSADKSMSEPDDEPYITRRPPTPSKPMAARPMSPPTPFEHEGGRAIARRRTGPLRPIPLQVVDCAGGTEVPDQRGFLLPAGCAYDHGPGSVGGLDQQGADPAGGGGHHYDVAGSQRGKLKDRHGCPAGTDHRDRPVGVETVGYLVQRRGFGKGQFGVPAAGHTQIDDHATAEHGAVDARSDRVDDAGDLPAGRHRQRRYDSRVALAFADDGVEQVHAGRLHPDAHLALARLGIRYLLKK